jgi:hypothetical protein
MIVAYFIDMHDISNVYHLLLSSLIDNDYHTDDDLIFYFTSFIIVQQIKEHV